MEELDDDFGDLYADVEVQASSAINAGVKSFNQLYLAHENKNETSDTKEGLLTDSSLKKVELISEKLNLHGSDEGGKPEKGESFLNDLKTSVTEDEGEKDDASDSEDGLNIVLNDEDCPNPRGTNMGNGGTMEGSDDEDEDDNLVIVMEGDGPNQDRKWVDQLHLRNDGGLDQSSASPGGERGNGIMGSYPSQYSQYKYIRPRATDFLNNAKTNGSGVAVSLSSSLPSRGDWDVNGCAQQIGSSSGPISSFCSTAIPVVAQNGFNFSLPRHRTILDVNIEAFEQKPWRYPGVDITDYFNFGLNEESWKEYCNSLGHFWQQANIPKKIPVYESVRPNQVYEAEFDYKTLAPDDVVEELAQTGPEERVLPVLKIADRGGRLLEMPKGRAIQVEGGIGERRPSMDIRRPQNRDSDVVIQIAVQDSREDSFGSGTEEPMHVDTSIQKVSENGGSYLGDKHDKHSAEFVDGCSRKYDVSSVKDAGVCSLRRCSVPKAASHALFPESDSQGNERNLDVDVYHHQKVKKHVTEETTEAIESIKSIKEVNSRNPSKADPFVSETESPLGDQIQLSLSSSDLDGRSEASKAGVDIGMEKTQNHAKRLSPNSFTGLQEAITSDQHRSKDSRSNDNKTEQGDYKNDSGSPSPMQEEQNRCSRMRLRSVAELKTEVDDDEAFSISDRKGWRSGSHLTKSHGTLRGRHHDYDFYDGEDLSYYRETKTSIGYCSGRFAKKQVSNGYTEVRHRKGHPHFRDEMDPYLSRHRDEGEPFLQKKITVKENKVKQREHYLCERGPTDEKMSSSTYEETTRSTSEDSSCYADKERHPSHRRKRNYGHRSRNGTEDKDFVVERRYREEVVQEKYGRPVSYSSSERKYFHENSERHVPYNGRQIRSSGRKESYGGSPSLDLDNSWMSGGSDDEFRRRPGDESFPSYFHRESRNTNGRRWRDATLLRNDLYASRKLDERYADHWGQSEERSDNGWLDPKCKDDHDAYGTVFSDDHTFHQRRYNRQSKALYWVEDYPSSRRRSRSRLHAEEASFSYERASRHERIRVDHDSAFDAMFLVENRLEVDRNKMIREENSNSEARDLISSGFDVIDKHKQTMPRCRYSVGLDLVGWKGKSSGRSTGVGDARCNGRRDNTDDVDARCNGRRVYTDHMDVRCNGRNVNTDCTVDKEQKTFRHSDESYTNAAQLHFPEVESNRFNTISSQVEEVGLHDLRSSTDRSNDKWPNKYKVTEQHEASMLEEGQLVVEEEGKKEVCSSEKKQASEKIAPIGDTKEKRFNSEDAVKESRVVGGYDNHQILETLAKMERRRERFKEPVALKEADKNPILQCDPMIETAEVKQQRPARKRRWGGN